MADLGQGEGEIAAVGHGDAHGVLPGELGAQPGGRQIDELGAGGAGLDECAGVVDRHPEHGVGAIGADVCVAAHGVEGDVVGDQRKVHFRGHDILEAAADALLAGATSDDGAETLPPLSAATQVLFSGSSAGSQGLTHHLDWWADKVAGASQVGGVLDSVFLPLVEDVDDPVIAERYDAGLRGQWANVRQDLYQGFGDESCLAAHTGDDAYLYGLTGHVQLNHITTPFFSRQDLTDPVTYPILQLAGASLAQYAEWTRVSMQRLASVPTTAEESSAISVAPGSHASNCGQHIVMLNGPWFGVAQNGNATVETADGTAWTVHDARVAWAMGTPIEALDTQPSTVSECAAATSEQ